MNAPLQYQTSQDAFDFVGSMIDDGLWGPGRTKGRQARFARIGDILVTAERLRLERLPREKTEAGTDAIDQVASDLAEELSALVAAGIDDGTFRPGVYDTPRVTHIREQDAWNRQATGLPLAA